MLNIKQRQTDLKYFGYRFKGSLNGKSSKELDAAVNKFQKTYKIKVGDYNSQTDKKLISKIKEVQKVLFYLGYDVSITGIFNSKDKKAVMSFQKKYKLKANGVIDAKTWKKLKYYYKKKKSKGRFAFQKMDGSINWSKVKCYGFTKEEFKCECSKYCSGYPADINYKIVYVAIKLRQKFKKPVQITCGLRCQKYNDSLVGSVPNSVHLKGGAIDFYIRDICDTKAGREKVKKYLRSLKFVEYTYSDTPNMGSAIHVNI